MADALSRLKRKGLYEAQGPEPEGNEFGQPIMEKLPPVKVYNITVPPKPVQDSQDIAPKQNSDKFCIEVKENFNLPKFYDYKVQDDILYQKTKVKKTLFDAVVVPSKLQHKILHAAHDNLGNMGINKTYAFLRQRYFWPGMKKQITNHIKTCAQCMQENLQAPPYVPGSLRVVNQPMYLLYMDLIGPFPTSAEGNTYCLTACCTLTDYLFCIPVQNKEAETVVQAYLKNTYSLFGRSKVLISDNGTEFRNSLFARVCGVLNMTQHFITAYLPSSNLVERHHSSLKKCITRFCKKGASQWDEIISNACMVQNLFPHTLEGESAMFKMFGRDPIVLDMEHMFEPKHRYLGDKDTFIDLEALCTLHMEIVARLKQARLKEEWNYPMKTILPKVGDAVLSCNHQKTGFAPTFLPGYRVIKKIDDSNYLIKHAVTG